MKKFAMLHRKQVSGEIQQAAAVDVSTKGKWTVKSYLKALFKSFQIQYALNKKGHQALLQSTNKLLILSPKPESL